MIKIIELLNIDKKLILASKSPRRKLLLENLGFEFEVIKSDYKEEKIDNHSDYASYVQELAKHKAVDVSNKIEDDSIIIAADTIVVLDNNILHKPKDREDAYKILNTLSNRTHEVYTGICLIDKNAEKQISDFQRTKVSFRELSDQEIKAYIDTDSPMDKAGAYGIQDDFGAVFVSHIEGCYYNIVGLPLELLYRMFKGLCQ